jgi:succinoglycan biosynthesis transport protein ExoP
LNENLSNPHQDFRPGESNAMRAPQAGARLARGTEFEGATVLASHTGDEGYNDNSLHQLLSMISRRRKIFLLLLTLALGASAAYLYLTPPIYAAVATLQVQAPDLNGSGEKAGDTPMAMSGITGLERSMATQLTIIQSNQVRQGAMKRVPPEIRAKLSEYVEIEIEPVGTTNLIEIRAMSHDREASKRLADAYCEEYIQLSRSENRGQLQQTLDYVVTQKDKVGKRLAAARNQLQRYQEKYGIIDVQSESSGIVSTAHEMRQKVEDVRAQRYVNEAEIKTTAQMIPTMKKIQLWPGGIGMRPEIQSMKGQITSLQLKRLEYLQKYRADRPEIKIIDDQIAAIKESMKGQAINEVNTWSQQANPIRSGLEGKLVELQVNNWSLQAQETALLQASAKAEAERAALPTRRREMMVMTQNLDALNDQYVMLNGKEQALEMAREARVANASPLFPAEMPDTPLSRAPRFIASALLVGLLLALALAALVDWLDDGIYTESDAKTVSQLPVLAQIPQFSRETEKSFRGGADASSTDPNLAHLRENFRMLRAMIALSSSTYPAFESYPAGTNGVTNGTNGALTNGSTHQSDAEMLKYGTPFGTSAIRSVVITSSLPNEGKSVSATNLAIAAALSGERVVLIDCDLRHPGLHKFFDLPNDVGIANVAAGTCTLGEALQNTRIPSLRVLTTGPINAEPLQILNSARARACLEELRQEADFIVIDTPPALVFAEAQVIAAMTDALLLVISSQDAKKREVARTRELFDQSGLVPLGTILNKLPPGSEGYYYKQYSYSAQHA